MPPFVREGSSKYSSAQISCYLTIRSISFWRWRHWLAFRSCCSALDPLPLPSSWQSTGYLFCCCLHICHDWWARCIWGLAETYCEDSCDVSWKQRCLSCAWGRGCYGLECDCSYRWLKPAYGLILFITTINFVNLLRCAENAKKSLWVGEYHGKQKLSLWSTFGAYNNEFENNYLFFPIYLSPKSRKNHSPLEQPP